MKEAKVRQLWNTLPFVNDFMKALEHQSKLFGEKQKKQQPKKGQPGSTNRKKKRTRVARRMLFLLGLQGWHLIWRLSNRKQ
jgi:hypothetical protein